MLVFLFGILQNSPTSFQIFIWHDLSLNLLSEVPEIGGKNKS